MPTTPGGLPYPADTDPVSDTALAIQALAESLEDWVTYDPTWNTGAIGNGTLAGWYLRAGGLLHYRITLEFGTTTTPGSGAWQFGLPPGYLPAASVRVPMGTFTAFQANTTRFGLCDLASNGAAVMGMDFANARLGAASPFAWAAGGTVGIVGSYRV